MPVQGPVHRLVIDFPDDETMLDWFDVAKQIGMLPERAHVCVFDALHEKSRNKPKGHLRRFIVKDPSTNSGFLAFTGH